MANISVIAPQLRALQAPEPLCDLQGWLIWKYEPRFEGDPKPLKVPYWADGSKRFGQQGNAHDRSKLTTFAMAREAAVRLGASGVGLALLPDWGITAFDFDNCMGPDGQMPPEVAHFASRTYTELSPSGKGARAFCFGDLGNHKTPTTPDQFGFETFHSTGFVTFTGDILPASDLLGLNNTIAPIDRYAEELCERRFSGRSAAPDPMDFMAGFEPRHGMTIGEIETLLDDLDPSMGRDDWIRVGMALHHETEGDDTGLELWNEWSSDAHNYVGREDLETQWDSFTRNAGPGRRQVTMASVKKMAATARAEEARRLSSVADVRAAAEAIVGESKTSGLSSPADFKGRFPILSAEVVGAQKPIDWLIKGVMPAADLIVLYGASTSGKAQPLSEPVLTPDGWSTMGAVKVGDYVIGSAGFPVRVVSVHPQGLKEIWEVEFSDGTVVRCCEDHLWKVRRHGKRWKVLTTAEVLANWPQRMRAQGGWVVPSTPPIQYRRSEEPLPIDPYVLGVLIGDGGLTAYAGLTSADQEIVDEVARRLPPGHYVSAGAQQYAYKITSDLGQPNHVWTALRLLGLAGKTSLQKFIPEDYKRTSPAARLALLQGLMDTDGWASGGGSRVCVFSSSSPELAEDVADLVRSLGGLARPVTSKDTTHARHYSVSFRMPSGMIPFLISRKADRCLDSAQDLYRTIKDIRPSGVYEEMQCISVASDDRLYVTTGYVLTHNTFVAIELAAAIARGVDWRGRRTRKGRVLYLTAEGGGGFGKRLKAYCQHNGITLADLDLAVMMAVPNILDTEDITEVIASMMAVGQFDAIIIDTLAQVTPGADENAGSDMGRALANLRTIREVTGATVCVVHHAGKDLSRGSRGWSGIRAAADAELEVSRDEMSGTREMRISKLKDGEDGVRFAFRLDVVTVGVDEDGDEITSCVMTEVEVQPLTKAQEAERKGIKRRGRIEAHVAEMVCTVDPDAAGMPLQDFVTLCADAWPAPEPGKRDTRRQAMTRAVHTLSREKDPPLALVKNFVNFLV